MSAKKSISQPIFLYEDIENKINDGWINLNDIPTYIQNNLSDRFTMRDYQTKAFQYFIEYMENNKLNKNRQIHLLFHMATGSGKTYIMAGVMLYLYQRNYRNFLFFVNSNNIIEKTKSNFLTKESLKYLFNDRIIIDGEEIEIKEVNNFKDSSENSINILFTTVQQLHIDLTTHKENSITIQDFEDSKVVLISDESHHINADTKTANLSKVEADEKYSWESSVSKAFTSNKDNIMLEFTATCDLKNANILDKYVDKIIFNYPLLDFRESGYTKDFLNLQSNYDILNRTVQAMLLSQYRLKLFQKYGLNRKPTILLKSDKISSSQDFYNYFVEYMKSRFSTSDIDRFRIDAAGIIRKMFDFFDKENITDNILVEELKEAFSCEHLIIMNMIDDASKTKQILVNDLENPKNPYRMIFTVDMLNEGWDVLNLFDIVRLYETRQSGRNKLSKTTISEAQLIGRGARYCPFKIDELDDAYKRKFDNDLDNELRVCETLYYHSKEDSRYIAELRQALKEVGFEPDKTINFEYKVKKSFKEKDIFKTGKLFVNEYKLKSSKDIIGLDKKLQSLESLVDLSTKPIKEVSLIDNNNNNLNKLQNMINRIKVKEIDTRITLKALRQYSSLRFNVLKKYFPNLKSSSEFLSCDNYAANMELVIITNNALPNNTELYKACLRLFEVLANKISNNKQQFHGTTEFNEIALNSVVKDTLRSKSNPDDEGEGISQNATTVNNQYRLDLSDKDWFVYTDNYGTTEEKRFVSYFSSKVEELRKTYNEVYLIRNERNFHIYSFADGHRFEPDYILILRRDKGSNYEQQQIFVEPKGEHLRKQDAWKEEFMLELERKAEAKVYHDDVNDYKIIGLPFYTHDVELQKFKDAFDKLK